jgi:serine/threonine-protein kinase
MGREHERARADAGLGRTLKGKWRLDRLVGVGGTAVVYAATHRTGARVAIKLLRPELSRDLEVCRRFRREAYLANAVRHPGVVTINDDDTDEDGTPFLVMELLQGQSVETLCAAAGGRLEVAFVREMALTVLDVLQAAHEHGVVHRDIKPSNLFRLETGQFRVLDFGVAASTLPRLDESLHTTDRTFLGTPAFMAPEQARSRWAEVDAKTDVWAVGATMFRLLAGEPVHFADTVSEQLGLAMTTSARSLGSVMPDLPADLVRVVDRALEYRPCARFPSARAMHDALAGHEEALDARPRRAPDELEDAAMPVTFLTPLVDSTVSQRTPASARASSAPSTRRARELPRFRMAAGLLLPLAMLAFGWVAFTPRTPPGALAVVKRSYRAAEQAPLRSDSSRTVPAVARVVAVLPADSGANPLPADAPLRVRSQPTPNTQPSLKRKSDTRRLTESTPATTATTRGARALVPAPAATSDPFDQRL